MTRLPLFLTVLMKAMRARRSPFGVYRDAKFDAEFHFWVNHIADVHARESSGEKLPYRPYRQIMMDAGGIEEVSFFKNKIVLDIGCGPRGSLEWLAETGIAKAAIGLDPLADRYLQLGIGGHRMLYLQSNAEHIPLPSEYVDVVFTVNSLDHTDNPREACSEIRRIVKPGGSIIGSFNLHEEPTATEPHELDEDFLQRYLFQGWERVLYKLAPKATGEDVYHYFYHECRTGAYNGPMILWCHYQKPLMKNR